MNCIVVLFKFFVQCIIFYFDFMVEHCIYMSNCTTFVLFVQFLTSIVKLYFDAVFVFHAGAPVFEEVTQLIDHYFAEGNVGVSFDQRCPVLSETQSQCVDGTEEVTQD